jgi:hypothetical protein
MVKKIKKRLIKKDKNKIILIRNIMDIYKKSKIEKVK